MRRIAVVNAQMKIHAGIVMFLEPTLHGEHMLTTHLTCSIVEWLCFFILGDNDQLLPELTYDKFYIEPLCT